VMKQELGQGNIFPTYSESLIESYRNI